MDLRRGSGTLEILIAFAVIILAITAAVSVAFGNQGLTVDTELNHQGFYKASRELDVVRAAAATNFDAIVSSTSTPLNSTSSEGVYTNIYSRQIDVVDVSPCSKQVTSRITWKTDPLRPQEVEVSTILTSTSTAAVLGGDCFAGPPGGKWQQLGSVSGGDGSVNGTGVDAQGGAVYMSANSTSGGKPDLLIYTYNASTKVITDRGTLNVSSGFNSIDVAGQYAYAANDESTFQLQVVDVADIDNPVQVASSSLDSLSIPASQRVDKNGSNPEGRTIYYSNGKIYLGLAQTNGPEFHVFSVSDPLHPVWLGSFEVNQDVNDIVVKGNYAYLATSDNSAELTVLNVSDPANITNPGSFNAAGNEDSQSLYILGNKLYLGRLQGADRNFLILDISSPAAPTNCATCSKAMASEDVNGITVVGSLAFLATSDNLEILDVSNPANISSVVSFSFSKTATGIDFDNNLIYIPFVKQGHDLMSIFYPGP